MRNVLLWNAGSWSPSLHTLSMIKAAQLMMYRRVLKTFRGPGETREDYLRRSAAICRREMAAIGADTWDLLTVRTIARWAGHVARLPSDRWASRILLWKGGQWRAALRNIPNIRGELGTLHGKRPGRPWRWEDPLIVWAGLDWHVKAAYKHQWSLWEVDFAQWRVHSRQGRWAPSVL